MILKLLGRAAIVVMILSFNLLGSVHVSVDKNVIYAGDEVVLTLKAEGDDIEFPRISMINDAQVLSTSSSQDIKIINGAFHKTLSKSYSFAPKESMVIPSYKVLVDGKVEKTPLVEVKVVAPSQDKKAQIVLDMRLSKDEVYVGEPIRFELVFKQKPNAQVYKLDIQEPKFESFWVKKLEGVKKGSEGVYSTRTYSYLLFAQQSGTLEIPAIAANVGKLVQQKGMSQDPFFSRFSQSIKYTKVFSNTLALKVKPLPHGLELVGSFKMRAAVDKTEVMANKPTHLTLEIEGLGNVDDIKKFELDIAEAIVYADDPVVKSTVVGEHYGVIFKQKIVIIADHDFVIPSLSLRYFDLDSKQEKQIQTKPISVKVIGAVAPQPVEDKSITDTPVAEKLTTTQVEDKSLDWLLAIALVVISFLSGGVTMWLYLRDKMDIKSTLEHPMAKQIKVCRSDRELFELLLPYKKESEIIDKVLELLESNLYASTQHKIDKKSLIDYFDKSEVAVTLI